VWALAQRPLLPQAYMRSGPIVESLEEDHPLPHALAVFAAAIGLAHQRCQALTQGQGDSFDPGGAHCIRMKLSIDSFRKHDGFVLLT
jgi:hypothetical protein